MKVACYTRVSTPEQNLELQLQELQDYAQRQDWEIGEIFRDVATGSNTNVPD